MRSLKQALHDHELIVLRVIGEWWELDLTGSDKAACVQALSERLAQLNFAEEMSYLPTEEAAALRDLIAQNGRLPVPIFSRRHGEVRLMGPGRLEREEPWFDPANVAEALWYRGFLYKGFDETAEGMIEFYYLPEAFMAQLPQVAPMAAPKTAVETTLTAVTAPERYQAANSGVVDDMTALLALAQQGLLVIERQRAWSSLLYDSHEARLLLLFTLAQEQKFLRLTDRGWRPTRAAVSWLQQSREVQMRRLIDAWSNSNWNALQHTPGLVCEGEGWQNDPILARTALIDYMPQTEEWFRIDSLINHIQVQEPDFQRPDGNYDTWYVRDEASDRYYDSFEDWLFVEGRLLRFLVGEVMGWLGLTETAVVANQTLYRFTPRALQWLTNQTPAVDEGAASLVVQADACLLVSPEVNRYERFRVARVSEAMPVVLGKPFVYQLTPQALALAREQGVTPERLLQFLQEASGQPVPKSVERAITRWSQKGVEARLETAVILRVRDAVILDTLRQNPKTRNYIGESLGELAASVRLNDWQQLRQAAAQLGLLLDSNGVNNYEL